MNSTLKKLRWATSSAQIADLIEKHCGNYDNPFICRQAYDALIFRTSDKAVIDTVRILKLLDMGTGNVDDHRLCKHLRGIVDVLRDYAKSNDSAVQPDPNVLEQVNA